MEQTYTSSRAYKKSWFDGKTLIIIFLCIALVVSIILNLDIVSILFKAKRYDKYLRQQETIKNEKGFDALKQTNDDFVAWLKSEDVNISLPIVKTSSSDDEKFYLSHAFNKASNPLGIPYQTKNTMIGQTDNTCIACTSSLTVKFFKKVTTYSLFSNLANYLSSDNNFTNTFSIETIEGTNTYQIISAYSFNINNDYSDKYSPFLYSNFGNPERFNEFYNTAKKYSVKNFGVDAEYGDKFVTLLSTNTLDLDYRIIIIAKQI